MQLPYYFRFFLFHFGANSSWLVFFLALLSVPFSFTPLVIILITVGETRAFTEPEDHAPQLLHLPKRPGVHNVKVHRSSLPASFILPDNYTYVKVRLQLICNSVHATFIQHSNHIIHVKVH